MSVIVTEYDAAWPTAFASAAGELTIVLGDNMVAIHHIGSTSIPNMWAKPVIDILAVVNDVTALDHRTPQIERLGYQAMGEFGIPGRRYFRRGNSAGQRTHQIHAFADGSPRIARHLAFRDYLRAHADVAAEYAMLKRRLAQQHPDDIAAYMDGKDAFIKETEARALAWVTHVR